MSGNINIRRDVDDKFYRYKMPRLIAKVEGKGNGIKTVIPNMSDIARSLNRPPHYPTKFFGIELGALVNCDAKTDRYIVNGAHTAERLQGLLDGFIKKFVLCGDCQNPETELVIKKNDDILRDCKACGASVPVDLRHKLTTYILKNPPTPSKKAKKEKKSKNQDDEDAENLPTPPETASIDSNDDDGDDELTRRINAEAAELKNITIKDDDDWAVDMSAEAVAARQKLLECGAIKKINGEEDEDDLEDPLELFADFITSHPKATAAQLNEEIERLGIRQDKAVVVYMQVHFNKTISANIISQTAPILSALVKDEKCQKGMLGGLERLVGELFPELLPKIPIFLKALYDEDLLDEEVIFAWGDKPSKKYVEKSVSKEIRAKAKPFLEWLKTADEESEEESD